MKTRNNQFHHKTVPERVALFFTALSMWIVLVWPVSPLDGSLLWADLGVGVIAAAIVALVMHEIIRVNFIRLVNPRSWFWAFIYLFVFSYYALRGGVDVAWRVLHPRMPIRPGIVRMKSVLETDTARAALANSITLTPGTLTMEVTDEGEFYVHWLFVSTFDEEEAAQRVLRRFEWYCQRIFE